MVLEKDATLQSIRSLVRTLAPVIILTRLRAPFRSGPTR